MRTQNSVTTKEIGLGAPQVQGTGLTLTISCVVVFIESICVELL